MTRTDIVNILTRVKPGLASKEIVEQSASFIFKDGRVITYNDEVTISHLIDLDITGAVPASEFFALLTKIKQEDIAISVKENEIKIKEKRFESGLAFVSEIKILFDEIPKPTNKKWKKLPANFLSAIKFASFSASTDMTKPVLTCVYINEATVQTCDNFRAIRIDLEEEILGKSMLIPARSALELFKYPVIMFQVAKGWAHFKTTDNVLFSCRTFAGKYPDTDAIFDVKGTVIKFNKKTSDALERAEIFSEPNPTDAKTVIMTLSENQITISSENEAVGWFKESFRIKYTGKAIQFGINSEFLKEILRHCNEAVIKKSKTCLLFKGDDFVYTVGLVAT